MLRNFVIAAGFLVSASMAHAQSAPNFSYGQVPTAAQWNSYFASKQDYLGYSPVNRAGDTMFGQLRASASSASGAGLVILPGTSPSLPDDGDVWTTAAGLFVQINGATVGPLASVVSPTFAGSVKLPGYTVASLPACVSALRGALAYVSDALSPTYGGSLTGGGGIAVPVFCDGSAWTSH